MRLIRLNISQVRNLKTVSVTPHPQFNLFWGKNGSGKTSFLESIHLLGLGRSFRSRTAKSLIHYGEPQLACFGEVLDPENQKMTMGIEKNRQGQVRYKIQGEVCDKLSQFASLLPLQLITPDTFKLLLAGSEERRRFLDWGVFHVEPLFATLCQRYLRLLKHRNAALKQFNPAGLEIWEKELAQVGESIHQQREAYVEALFPFIKAACEALLPALSIGIHYQSGWAAGISLSEALQISFAHDKRLGHTSVGPHRGEVHFEIENFPASLVLSRGQQKAFIFALHLAQGAHLAATKQKRCLYLLDDLASELDEDARERLLILLAQSGHQVFITGVSADFWPWVDKFAAGERFHVEQGELNPSLPLCGLSLYKER